MITGLRNSAIFFFENNEIHAIAGQTVGSALLENNVRVLRRTRFEGAPRGMFCGIGVCFDCVVTINGVANQRACLVEVEEGMRVEGFQR